MKKVVCVIPHSHSFFWTQTCVAALMRNPPKAQDCEVRIVLVDNSPWSPAIKGVTETNILCSKPDDIGFDVIPNTKSNKFHASALDCVIEKYQFDYFMALETDVLVLRPNWLDWFIGQLRETDYAVGHWHHEQFINPSCTLYRGSVLHEMMSWCKANREPNVLRWGPRFENEQLITERQPERDYRGWYDENIDWIAGPFAEKRGWPAGTVLKETPSGQMKGVSWYEPGQQLHHWATDVGHTYTVCPSLTTNRGDGLPLQTMYGATMPDPGRQLEAVELFGNAEAAHLWGGTRALDIIKHEVTCQFVKANTPMWLAREARFWKEVVPAGVQAATLELIRRHGFHITGQGNDVQGGSARDREAAVFVKECYAEGGVEC